jgi:hypothetical protein
LYLKNVSVAIDYANVSKVGTSSPKNVIASSQITPSSIQIRGEDEAPEGDAPEGEIPTDDAATPTPTPTA